MKNSLIKGQVSLTIAIVGAVGMITASVFTAWATANSRVSMIDKQIGIVEERENNHYLEVSKQLKMIDEKLERLIERK